MTNYKSKLTSGTDYFSLKESDFFLTKPQKESIVNNISTSGHQLLGTTYNIIDPPLSQYALHVYL